MANNNVTIPPVVEDGTIPEVLDSAGDPVPVTELPATENFVMPVEPMVSEASSNVIPPALGLMGTTLVVDGREYDLNQYRELRYWQPRAGIGVCYLIRKGENHPREENLLPGVTAVGQYEEIDALTRGLLRG